MAVDRIVAWLRLRDTARFRRDAWRAAKAIRDIKDAAKEGEGPLNQLGGALNALSDGMPLYSGRTRIFGFAIGTVLTAATAAIPILVSLGGSLTAVAGSAGAAAIGFGLLGVAVAGAAIPLGAFGLVAMQAFQAFGKVNTAFTNWRVQVNAFGRNSEQAETALKRLHGITKEWGGPAILNAVKAWRSLSNSFQEANAPALRELWRLLTGIMHTLKNVLPVFATMAYEAGKALNLAIMPLRHALESREFRDAMTALTDSFRTLAGPMIQSITNLLMGFLQIASRLSGEVGPLGEGLVRITAAFRNWATSGDLSVMLDHLSSWWNLGKAIVRLMFTLFSTGASDGQTLVQTLTGIVNKWNEFLGSAEGQSALRDFFRDAISSTKVFIGIFAGLIEALFDFGRATMGPFAKAIGWAQEAWQMFMDALAPAKPFFDSVLGPLLKGIFVGVFGSVVGAFKFVLMVLKPVMFLFGLLGKVLKPLKPIFFALGWVIGFLFGGWILKVMAWLSKLTIILSPIGTLLKALAIPLTLAGKLVGWFGSQILKLIGWGLSFISRFIGPIRNAIDNVIDWLTGAGSRFFDAGMKLWKKFKDGILRAIGAGLGFAGDIAKAVWNFIAGNFNKFLPDKISGPGPLPDLNLPDNPLPMLAEGGVVSGSGSWITGEAGPEINTLVGGKVVVKPLTPGVAAMGTTATLAPDEPRVIVTKVYLRGRQIAEAVADEAADERARRGKNG